MTAVARPRVVVLGAGMSGLVAARALVGHHDVVVVDKGRGVGGRAATRRLRDAAGPPAVVDHGAPFVQDDPALDELVAELAAADVLRPGPPDGAGRRQWRARPGMTAIAKHLATGLDVRVARRVVRLEPDGDRWLVHTVGEPDGGPAVDGAAGATSDGRRADGADAEVLGADAEVLVADAVVATAPVPQLLDLADASDLSLDPGARGLLESVRYDPALLVIADLDASGVVGSDGVLRPAGGPVALVVDHCVTGTSTVPAVTVRARSATARSWFDRPDDAVAAGLLDAVGLVASGDTRVQVRRWRYARAAEPVSSEHLVAASSPLLVVAGDAFGARAGAAGAVGGGRAPVSDLGIAYRSGQAGAAAVAAALSRRRSEPT